MKKLTGLMALIMVLSCVTVPSVAETANIIKESNSGFYYIEANETSGQAQLSAADKEMFISADGLYFKDMNKNGQLDGYEDWRNDNDTRITDLLSQMTIEEETGLLFHANSGGTFSPLYPKTDEWMYSHEPEVEIDGTRYVPMWYMITEDHVNHYLDNNTGTPLEQLTYHNLLQKIGEETRLGVPVTFSSDREYNTWGSMINMGYAAFGYAHDQELLADLVGIYSREMDAIGYHLLLHPYGVEIGSWYGEDPTLITGMITTEVKAIEENNMDSCTKHFIARGGRSSFEAARSEAQLVDNWMTPWQAAIDAGTDWIMINEGAGLSNDVWVQFDQASMDYLRNDLGFKGVILSDWPIILGGVNRGTVGGDKDYSSLTLGECYTMMLEYGMDQFGEDTIAHGTDPTISTNDPSANWPDTILECIDNGTCDVALVHRAASHVLNAKFNRGIFEDPYRDADAALTLLASDAYRAEQFEINNNADIYAARNAATNELEDRLQTESAVLVKNDQNLLPLKQGAKVYVTGSSDKTQAMDAAAMAAYATVVDQMADADVVVARMTALDDMAEMLVQDAQDEGKPVVLVADCAEPNTWAVENCDAILYLTFSNATDHGASYGDFFTKTLPSILADMLFGQKEPTGKLVFEIARNADDTYLDFGDLQYDMGVSTETRLYMSQLVRNDPTAAVPNNLGDVLYTSNFGMRYHAPAAITATTLVTPKEVVTTMQDVNGSTVAVSMSMDKKIAAGEAFDVSFVLQNDGSDGYINAEVYDGDQLIASKFMALEGGQFRVVTFTLTLNSGEHVLSVCGLQKTLTIE